MINLISVGSDIGNITINVFNAIIESDIIVNYDNLDLSVLDTYIKDKEIIVNALDESNNEVIIGLDESESIEDSSDVYSKLEESYSKIELAISKASQNNVALICSNKRNIYGIANLLIQISSKYDDLDLKIYPAVSPIDYSSAVLGAPFNDFVSIDLNNPLVSEKELKNKIKFALKNDFVLFIHNPLGEDDDKANFNLLKETVNDFNDELLLGIVNESYSYEISCFKDINEESIKEDSALIIGNRLTYKLEDYMVTSSEYIVKPKFISQNIDFFERYLKDETPKGLDYDCEYLPCHKALEACDFCYCPFYPCADGLTGGEWIKNKDVWSCQHCDWIHLEEPCQAVRKGLEDILEDKNDLKAKHMELLKLRRECLLKTLK
ncbi:cysteine-rich small domain-containing protein [uncultured Methanobrevibacter sp.]|uniref:cysteine-rich small domain-containing protein n=2 Tax=uncultured Methanobrevibacter sp. TaxID=253161 RepID=UPI0025D5202D|nr:cysteine-rich small domain-containing protein [uncultured Methanobrevibacter sp.]